jgi:hypothetical protein
LSLLCWMLVVVFRGFLFFKRWVLGATESQ